MRPRPSKALNDLAKKMAIQISALGSLIIAFSGPIRADCARNLIKSLLRDDPSLIYQPSVLDEFQVTNDELESARHYLKTDVLNSTLFIIPKNDGEALRAVNILKAVDAPRLHVSSQPWGATLDKEYLSENEFKGVKRIAVFEMPSPEMEESLRKRGFEVTIIDHHAYDAVDRTNPANSSLEQLAKLIGWPLSKTDMAVAVNDRGYIPGLKKLGLSNDEIRRVRKYDLVAQGRSDRYVDGATGEAQRAIPNLIQQHGIYFIPNHISRDVALLKQELAIQSPNGIVSAFQLGTNSVNFSGNPEIVKKLSTIDFRALGYQAGSYARYSGGDPHASMFWGFKPTKPPIGDSEDLIPTRVLKTIEDALGTKIPTDMLETAERPTRPMIPQFFKQTIALSQPLSNDLRQAGMLPKGSAIITDSGQLREHGIKAIIHAASGSMTRSGLEFDPTLESVGASVENSMKLAHQNGFRRVAIPFIGGKIFLKRIGVSADKLAREIVGNALRNRNGLEIRFIAFDQNDAGIFQKALDELGGSIPKKQVEVEVGSITDAFHGSDVIVNAANMEVAFGGGLSGVIGQATGYAEQIERQARKEIQGVAESR